MPKVLEIVKRLFPAGTLPGGPLTWARAPIWPPDVFAAAASLVGASGCYSRARYTAQWKSDCLFRGPYLSQVTQRGAEWRKGTFPDEVQRLWRALIKDGDSSTSDPNAEWCDAAMKLMTLADEASAGIGFLGAQEGDNPFADYVVLQHSRQLLKNQRGDRFTLPYLPVSLCWQVPPSELCVQPKTMTPKVGCTLRSLSHHLALLPPSGEITTSWMFSTPATRARQSIEPLNVLIAPFPYRVDGNSFRGESFPVGDPDRSSRFFTLRQGWLGGRRSPLKSRQLGGFLVELVRQAKREVRDVHGLVLPEAALDGRDARPIARELARKTDLELFITGVLDVRGLSSRGLPQNRVYTAVFYKHRILTDWLQSKHHRWRLDRSQICRYNLGDALDPAHAWWEKIELPARTCNFYVFRHGASLAALVCEDLARIDPVQVALRSVGPNLVVVLLMDGPQYERRWPGKYATVLADDPGSAVLTLTSLGMVERSQMPGDEAPRSVALWRERGGAAQELRLPAGRHALLLTLSQSEEICRTLDGRLDHGTIRLSLTGVHAVKHPAPPPWVDPGLVSPDN